MSVKKNFYLRVDQITLSHYTPLNSICQDTKHQFELTNNNTFKNIPKKKGELRHETFTYKLALNTILK